MANLLALSKVQTKKAAGRTGRIFISHQQPESDLGKLFVLLEAPAKEIAEQTLDEIVELINRAYYSSVAESANQALEELGGRLNQELADLFRGSSSKTFSALTSQVKKDMTLPDSLDIFLGAFDGKNLHFAKTGAVTLLLQHGLSLYDITKQNEDAGGSGNIFDAITSGPLAEKNIAVITGAATLDYFSLEQIKEILQSPDVQLMADRLSNLADKHSPTAFFQAIIMQLLPDRAESDTQQTQDLAAVESSVSQLNAMQSRTAEIMRSSVTKGLSKSLSALFGERQKKEKSSDKDIHQAAIRRRELHGKKIRRTIVKLSQNIWFFSKILLTIILWLFKSIFKASVYLVLHRKTLLPQLRGLLRQLPQTVKTSYREKKIQYRTLSKRQQLLLGLLAVLVLALIISLAAGLTSGVSQSQRLAFAETVAEIENKQSAAEAALIYSNETQAVELIAGARGLLASLPDKPADLKNRKTELATALFETYRQLQKLEEINAPVEIVDLSNLPQSDSTEPLRLDLLDLSGSGTQFYALTSDQQLYHFDLNSSKIDQIALFDDNIEKLFPYQSDLLVYSSRPENILGLYVTANNTVSRLDINFNDPLTQKTAVVEYFERLYVLDQRNRQIYRHQRVGNSYPTGSAWLTDETVDLSGATDMAIDGNIWVTTSNGQLYKISQGKAETLNLGLLDPSLNAPNFVWTALDTEYVYILDPPTRRVIIINKDGSIHQQFVSSFFDDMRSAVINEPGKEIYLLNGSKMYLINFN